MTQVRMDISNFAMLSLIPWIRATQANMYAFWLACQANISAFYQGTVVPFMSQFRTQTTACVCAVIDLFKRILANMYAFWKNIFVPFMSQFRIQTTSAVYGMIVLFKKIIAKLRSTNGGLMAFIKAKVFMVIYHPFTIRLWTTTVDLLKLTYQKSLEISKYGIMLASRVFSWTIAQFKRGIRITSRVVSWVLVRCKNVICFIVKWIRKVCYKIMSVTRYCTYEYVIPCLHKLWMGITWTVEQVIYPLLTILWNFVTDVVIDTILTRLEQLWDFFLYVLIDILLIGLLKSLNYIIKLLRAVHRTIEYCVVAMCEQSARFIKICWGFIRRIYLYAYSHFRFLFITKILPPIVSIARYIHNIFSEHVIPKLLKALTIVKDLLIHILETFRDFGRVMVYTAYPWLKHKLRTIRQWIFTVVFESIRFAIAGLIQYVKDTLFFPAWEFIYWRLRPWVIDVLIVGMYYIIIDLVRYLVETLIIPSYRLVKDCIDFIRGFVLPKLKQFLVFVFNILKQLKLRICQVCRIIICYVLRKLKQLLVFVMNILEQLRLKLFQVCRKIRVFFFTVVVPLFYQIVSKISGFMERFIMPKLRSIWCFLTKYAWKLSVCIIEFVHWCIISKALLFVSYLEKLFAKILNVISRITLQNVKLFLKNVVLVFLSIFIFPVYLLYKIKVKITSIVRPRNEN